MEEGILDLDEEGRDDPDSAMGGLLKRVAKTFQELVFPYPNHLPKLRQMEEDQHISFGYMDIFRPTHLSDYLEKAKEQREKEIEVREKKIVEENNCGATSVQQLTEAKALEFNDTTKLIGLEGKNVGEEVVEHTPVAGKRTLELKDTGFRDIKPVSKEKEQKIVKHILDIKKPNSMDAGIIKSKVRGSTFIQQKNQDKQQKNIHQINVESKRGAFKPIEIKNKPKPPVELKTTEKNLLNFKLFRDRKPLDMKNREKRALDFKIFNVKPREPKHLELKGLDPKPKIFPPSRNFRDLKPMPRLNIRRK